MSFVSVTRHATGRRLFILAHRMHHGDWGLLAIFGGVLACALDWADRREWLHFKREVIR